MDNLSFVWVIGVLALGAGVVALGAWAYPVLKNQKQGYWREDDIERVVLPYVYAAICAAYKLSERALEETGERMEGADKKIMADYAYGLLPDDLYGINVKKLVSQEQFENFVQENFDRAMYLYRANIDKYELLFERWKAESDSKPETA